jgi:hypothetical protein
MVGAKTAEFSTFWMVMSILTFLVAEVILGWFVGTFLLGGYVSQMWHLRMQVLLYLGAYFVGGIFIGVVSPGLRMIEPAMGAFVSVFLTLAISLFLPYTFMRLSFGKLVVGGLIAFAIAFAGARIGERFMGNAD